MVGDSPIAFFDPRLGELRGILRDGNWRDATSQDTEVELLEAELAPRGEVALRVRFVDSGNTDKLSGLCGTHEDADGRLALELRDCRFLVFTKAFQARVRDVVLSLANRPTPYF